MTEEEKVFGVARGNQITPRRQQRQHGRTASGSAPSASLGVQSPEALEAQVLQRNRLVLPLRDADDLHGVPLDVLAATTSRDLIHHSRMGNDSLF